MILGIEEEDWPKIKQVVMEVHNLDDRIETVQTLLERHGFNKIVVEQEGFSKGSENFNLYAFRLT